MEVRADFKCQLCRPRLCLGSHEQTFYVTRLCRSAQPNVLEGVHAVMLSFYLGYKRGIAALKIHRSLLKNIFEKILPRRSCGFTAPSPTSNAIARHACMNRLMMPTSARLTSFSESRGGSSGTSPAVPKRNPSRSDLSRWHDRGCYRTESRRRLDCVIAGVAQSLGFAKVYDID
jgi:hypothetical protein